jgi:acyl-coenzyme A synthetase/AMP-(fatty) acid ligase
LLILGLSLLTTGNVTGGVRFGSSELYDTIDGFGHPIQDSLAVGQSMSGGTDERVVLFLQLAPGHTLDESLIKKVKAAIRQTWVNDWRFSSCCVSVDCTTRSWL